MDSPAEFFQLLSDTTRIRLLVLLNGRELCVCQLMGALGMSQARVSQQLAILKHSGLITNSKVGKWNYYKINPRYTGIDFVQPILASLPIWLNGNQLVKSDLAALQACFEQQERTGQCDTKSFSGIRAKLKVGQKLLNTF